VTEFTKHNCNAVMLEASGGQSLQLARDMVTTRGTSVNNIDYSREGFVMIAVFNMMFLQCSNMTD